MIIDEVLQQLQSADPEERKKAIVTLGRLRNKAALKPLEEVYRNDPDPDLRNLALKVAHHIQYQSQTTSPIRGTVTEPDFLPDTSPWDMALSEPPPARERSGPRRGLLRRYLPLVGLLLFITAILLLLFQFHRLLPL